MGAYLVDVDSSDSYLLTEPECRIGSDQQMSDLVIAAESVLPEHLHIEKREEEYWVNLSPGATNTKKYLLIFNIPTASLNGHILEGEAVQIVDGDRLKIGSRLLQFRIA